MNPLNFKPYQYYKKKNTKRKNGKYRFAEYKNNQKS